MFKEPVQVVKSRGSLKSLSLSPLPQQLQQHHQSGSLVSAVLDSASSASPRIYPLDPGNSIELLDNNNNNNNFNNHHNNQNTAPSFNPGNNRHNKTNNTRVDQLSPDSSNASKRNELSKRVIPTAPPYPPLVQYAPAPLGIRGSAISRPIPPTPINTATSTTTKTSSISEKEKEAQIVPESNGFGKRLLNGYYDEFFDGLPFRRQSANNYCDPPPARRYSLMGRAGTARNSEFKRNPIAQHRQR